MLKSLDLFSGCGGITHALRGIAHPVMYCEWEPSCQETLKTLMTSGKLPKAPIHGDVQTLRGTPLKGTVDILMGGWPCFPAGTPVLTDKGYLPIETVTGTELLLTHTGSWKPIENLQRKLFTGRMASVSIKRHFQPIRCTDNHPFYARTLTNAEPDWVPARNLTEKHYVGFPVDKVSVVPTFSVPSFIENGYVWYAITDVSFSNVDKPEWVYNFQVQDDHSYVVQNIVVKNCVGFSNAGKRQGFENAQSGLFAHVVRLVKEIQPKCVFMENVVPVTHGTGIQNVCASIGKLGYVLWWLTLPAYATGPCPHVRQRWFCLGVRREYLKKLRLTVKAVDPHCWKKEPVPRMISTSNTTNTKRLGMLGNSVVPDAVRAAFLMLWTGTTIPQIAFKAGTYVVTPPTPGTSVVSGNQCPYGMYDGRMMVTIPPPILPKKPALKLVLHPAGVPQPTKLNPAITTDIITEPVNFTLWSTPRHGNTGPSRVLTMRSKGDLPTQLRYEKKTPKKMRLGHPSADWVDWLMGYEPGWTAF